MYGKIVWCYVIVLTLLDISLNTQFSAQGKSHGNGVSVHESLMEGISLQEWGKEPDAAEAGAGAGAGALPPDAVSLAPAALAFGRRALAAAHALSVTITNTDNETIHLASVAGTTPDFHASFFESKTLAPQANTTFSVVYLGRREGPVAAHLYIHTSRGVHKYPVSAVGVASEWRVWPLVGLRVPHNATLEPLLALYNPTDTTIQVHEVYSSAAWLGLALPGGGGAAPRDHWTLPPHTTRPLVRLRLQPPPSPHPHRAPLTAYVRIKGNMTGGALVLGVEAAPCAPGEFLSPLQLRLRTRGSRDPPDTVYVSAGSSEEAGAGAGAGARLEARVWDAACRPPARAAPPPAAQHASPEDAYVPNGAAQEAGGVHVALLRDRLDPQLQMTQVAQLTLDYAKMWASYENKLKGVQNGWGHSEPALQEGAYCAGSVRLGRALLPYSLRLLRGTLALSPREMHFVTCNEEEALMVKELVAHNEFPEPLRITYVEFPPEVQELFHTRSLAPLELAPGAARAACTLRLRGPARAATLRSSLTLHTNLTDYTLPVLLYEGTFNFEWDWPNSSDGTLRLGTVSTSSALSVGLSLHNPGPAPLCVTDLAAHLPPAPAHLHPHPHSEHPICVEAGGSVRAVLEARAPTAEGGAWGSAVVRTAHCSANARLQLRARAGRVHAHAPRLPPAAPWVGSAAPLEVESSMRTRMRVTHATVEAPPGPAALHYVADEESEVGEGRTLAGSVRFSAEALCQPACYTGLQLDTPEGAAWEARGARPDDALALDAALQRARYDAFAALQHHLNYTVYLHTTEVVRIPASGSATLVWPRVWSAGSAEGARAPLAAVGGGAGAGAAGGAGPALRLRAHNPARLPLLLQPRLAQLPPHLPLGGEEEDGSCVGCVWSAASFQLGEWRATRGQAAPWRRAADGAPYLLLQPAAEVEFTVHFAPAEPADLAAYFYLRNNLTIVDRVLVRGRGALPAFEVGGRKPNSTAPITLEVTECGAQGGAGVARRVVALRNTGRVALRLRAWRVAGGGGAAFRLQPATPPAALPPAGSAPLTLTYRADWTRARDTAYLSVVAGGVAARFPLAGLARARLLRACAPPPRAPLEPTLQAAAAGLAVAALIGVLMMASLDAERALRRHRSARECLRPRAPLDLRALGRAEPAPSAAGAAPAGPAPSPAAPAGARGAAARRRRTPRRRGAAGEACVERRAFERWRAGAAGEAPPRADDSHSEEEDAPPAAPPPRRAPRGDASSSSPDSSPPPPQPARDSYSSLSRRAEEEDEEDEECASTGSESLSPGEGDADGDEGEGEEGAADDESSAWGAGRRAAPPARAHDAPHATHRGSRQRRESAEARRTERKSAEAGGDNSSNGGGGGAGGSGAGARGSAPRPPRSVRAPRRRAPSPHRPAPRPAPHHAAQAPHAPLRWGASWSDVVSRGNAPNANEGGGGGSSAALAPIGSDVRRRLASHSLFYYGGAPAAWTPAPPPAPAAPEAPPPAAAPPAPPSPRRAPGDEGSGYRSLESLWGAPAEPAGAWLWGGAAEAPRSPETREAVRPPPGFGSGRPLRPYDPFQSLASIWTPAALDWRRDTSTPPPATLPATPPLPDDKFDPTAN